MSYWVYLRSPEGETLSVDHHIDGGTYALGVTNQAEVNVTYNYSKVFNLLGFSIRDLHEKVAGDTIPILRALSQQLPDRPDDDYWAPTPGNAGHVIHAFLKWAKQYPTGIWEVH